MENKENSKSKSASTLKSYFKNSKSSIPRSASSKRKPTDSAKKSRVRPVPDFSKVHQNWQKKLEHGKAFTKKPCTVSQEFDLTHPGTTFTRAEQREITGNDSLSSLCDVHMDCDEEEPSQPAANPQGGPRRVLGEISCTEANSPNKPQNKTQKRDVLLTKEVHILEEQAEIADKFESDDSALASILSGQGIRARRGNAVAGRFTEIPGQTQKNSMYTPKVARLSVKDSYVSPFNTPIAVPIRNSIYVKYIPRAKYIVDQNTTPTKQLCHTPITAGRVLNPAFSASKRSASRVYSPASFLRPGVAGTTPRLRKTLRWADVLANPDSEPESEKEPLARTLTQTDYEVQDTEKRAPATTPTQAPATTHTQDSCQQDKEIRSSRNQREVMAKDEESTVAVTRKDRQADSQPTVEKISEVSSLHILNSEHLTSNMVPEVGESDVQTFIKKTLKRRRQSVDEINQSLCESRVHIGELNSQAKRLCCVQGGGNILQRLSVIKQQQAQLAKLQQELQEQLQTQLLLVPDDNRRPDENCNSLSTTNTNGQHSYNGSQQTCSPISEKFTVAKHQVCNVTVSPNLPKPQINNMKICQNTDNSLPLDLSVRSKTARGTPEISHPSRRQEQQVLLQNIENRDSDETILQLTPYITRGVKKLQLTTGKGGERSGDENLEPDLPSLDFDHTKKDSDGRDSCRLPVSQSPFVKTVHGPSSLCNPLHQKQSLAIKGSPWRIVSPVSERALTNNNGDDDDNTILPPPPIWTPLALSCAGAINSGCQRTQPNEDNSHGASPGSMVEHDTASRCQSADDSSSKQCLESLSPSPSYINQSTESEDGRTGRHLTPSPAQGMTHSSTSTCTSLSSGPFHNSTSCLQSVDGNSETTRRTRTLNCGHCAGPVAHNCSESGKDGPASADEDASRVSANCTRQPDCDRSDIHYISCSRKPTNHKDHKKTFRDSRALHAETVENSQQQNIDDPEAEPSHSGDTVRPQDFRNSSTRNRPTSRSVAPRTSRVHPDTVGPLSLRANVHQVQGRFPEAAQASRAHRRSPRIRERLEGTNQMFQDALLDEECALFTCRLQQTSTADMSARCPNPVAKILCEGDGMHFLPISDDYHGGSSQLEGSAFSSYTPSHTRSMSRMP